MSDIVIRVENLSKYYRLGLIGGGTLREDLQRWWAMARGLPDPLLKIGMEDHGTRKGGQVWALRDVSFNVTSGDIVGIIGRNGAGKSTLLKILSRITAPTSGTAKIKGRVGSLLEVGTGFHPELTGRENTYLNGAILGMKKREIDKKFDEIVAFAEIEKFIDTPVKRYSSGMHVRLAFAVAAHLDPEILIVDEVLAVGDITFQKKCIGKMQKVSGDGRTVLFVSHNMSSIRSLCGQGILLESGRVVMNDKSDRVVDSYFSKSLSEAKKDLCTRSDRVGNGSIRINKIDIVSNDTGRVIDTIMPGMNVTFRIHYERKMQVLPFVNVCVGLEIHDASGHFVTVLNNLMANYKIRIDERRGVIQCKVNRFPLMYGTFHIRSIIHVDGEVGDVVDNAASIHVEEGDFYSSGEPNAYNRQGVYIEQAWD